MAQRRRSPGEGSITFDKSKGKYVGRAMIRGQRRKVVRATKNEAQKALMAMMAEAERGVVTPGNVTVRTAVESYKVRRFAGKDLAPSTRTRELWALDHVVAQLGGRKLKTLTVTDIEMALDRLGSSLSRESLLKVRGALGRVLNDAIRRGETSRNLAKLAELPADARRTPERKSLTPVEARKLIETCEGERLGALFVFMLGTGVRPGEAAAVTWSALDFTAGTVAIRAGRQMDSRGSIVLVDDLKTKGSRRTLGMPSWLVETLRTHRAAQATQRLAAAVWTDHDLAFPSAVGTPLSEPSMRRALASVCEKAGIEPVSPNVLRHSAASLMIDSGLYLQDVADHLGHSSTRVLETTYKHALRPSLDVGAAALESLASGH